MKAKPWGKVAPGAEVGDLTVICLRSHMTPNDTGYWDDVLASDKGTGGEA
jgi:hypothetical protein